MTKQTPASIAAFLGTDEIFSLNEGDQFILDSITNFDAYQLARQLIPIRPELPAKNAYLLKLAEATWADVCLTAVNELRSPRPAELKEQFRVSPEDSLARMRIIQLLEESDDLKR